MHMSRACGSATRKGIDVAGRAARATIYQGPRPADLRRR